MRSIRDDAIDSAAVCSERRPDEGVAASRTLQTGGRILKCGEARGHDAGRCRRRIRVDEVDAVTAVRAFARNDERLFVERQRNASGVASRKARCPDAGLALADTDDPGLAAELGLSIEQARVCDQQ